MTLAVDSVQPAKDVVVARRTRCWPVASLATFAVVLLLWQLASTLAWVSPVFLPPLAKVIAAVGRLVTQGYVDSTLGQHAWASLSRVFLALFFEAPLASRT